MQMLNTSRFGKEIGQSTENSWEWKEEGSHAFMKEPIRVRIWSGLHITRESLAEKAKSARSGVLAFSDADFLGGWIPVFSRLFSQPFLHFVGSTCLFCTSFLQTIFAAGAWRRPIGVIPSPILYAEA
jgi:hypothetical protein